ncbi:substrate-binding periplasmic protein [Roseateles saccharophilus]|uniref:Polar amino acid transport system substrate-binding protein n=1 Tax=Roseateles saccharophilus TaxID=304 RepID=A0A4R3UQA8_ROSSA|nr:transporter substrate-binding domain-containing protein [Roseateles saccharophilus]MDG0833568.1 transporter substrate-binding domain-containing protein [Roseateles saccharophilus]TCU92184.1 polar amino acid transport system substrate-binding protein [Roseateles saccharophilus]
MASPFLTRRQCCIAGAVALTAGARAADSPVVFEPSIRISTLALESDPTSQLAAKVMLEAYRRMGMEADIVSMPGERSLVSANAGETDAELYRKAGMEKTYPNLVMVPVPVASYEVVAFVPSHSVLSVNGWASLQALRMAFVKGIKVIEENTGGMQVVPVASLQQAFGMLDRGRVDVVLANRISGLATLRSMKLTGIEPRPQPLASFPVFHYVNVSRQALLPKLSQVLQDMTRERWIQHAQDEIISRY